MNEKYKFYLIDLVDTMIGFVGYILCFVDYCQGFVHKIGKTRTFDFPS